MSITFNAFEIFEMAEQIERNGIKFYRKAAQSVSDGQMRQILEELADMEAEHEETFADMRKQLSEETRTERVFDPENEMALYLQAMASGHVFDLRQNPSEQLKGTESIEEILNLGLKDFLPVKAGKDKVEAIIKEEMGHIAVLNRRLPASK